jgi:hypothetical protein
MQSPFPSPPLPLHPRYFLVRASFANKKNSTARGWGLGAEFCAWSPSFLVVFIKQTHEQHQKYSYSYSIKIINKPSAGFPPSLRLKEHQTKPTS